MSWNQGRKNRKQRIVENSSGAWGSSSQDFSRLAFLLFEQSARYAKNSDENCSIYTLAGIPMLLSALRCLLIELNSDMYSQKKLVSQKKLAGSANDVQLIIKSYELSEELKSNLRYLSEIRNEIIHPAHKPTGTKNNTPSYLNAIRKKRILQSTGDESSDYIWISQLQSHKLFEWAFENIANTVNQLLNQHEISDYIVSGISENYTRFRDVAF